MKTMYFQTFGCQMNVADTGAIKRHLMRRGFVDGGSHISCDLVIVNTCSVREAAEKRALARIAEFANAKKSRPGQKLWVIGCMAQRLGDGLKERIGGIDLVIGAKSMERIEEIIDEAVGGMGGGDLRDDNRNVGSSGNSQHNDENAGLFNNQHDDHSPPPMFEKNAVSDFVPVMRGCDNYCAYCVVPYVRGRERSVPCDVIESTIIEKINSGIKEITLLGQNVNSYQFGGIGFPQLLLRLSRIDGLSRIRFTTSHPKDCTEELIDVMTSSPKFASHIHLPVQAGSDRILSLMNRKYTSSHYRNLIEMIRKRLPQADITSDILVGFPTETDAEFRETLALVRDVRYTTAFMFAYSPREGTAAAGMEELVSKEEKNVRLAELIAVQTEITREIYDKTVGKTLEVLITGRQEKRGRAWMGQDSGCKRVLISCETAAAGMIFNIRAVRSTGMTLIGEIKA